MTSGIDFWFFFLSYLITTACVVPRGRASVFCVRKGVILKLVSRLQFFQRRTWSREILIPSTSWTAPSKSNFGFSFLLSKVQSTPPLISEKSNGVQSSKLQYCGLSSICLYRVLKCDVIKMKFLKLWDLSVYFERTMSKRPTCQKWAFGSKLSLRS